MTGQRMPNSGRDECANTECTNKRDLYQPRGGSGLAVSRKVHDNLAIVNSPTLCSNFRTKAPGHRVGNLSEIFSPFPCHTLINYCFVKWCSMFSFPLGGPSSVVGPLHCEFIMN